MKGRLAPTPSGYLHLGNAFSALLCWLSVRSQNGEMLLRMEDLDPSRCRPEYTQAVLEDLLWLGLTWDEGPVYQSRRKDFYEEILAQLAEKKLLYPCFCSRAQLHAASAPHESDGHFVYSGHCRKLGNRERALQKRAPAMRVKVPCKTISFLDTCQGFFSQNLQTDCGDFLVRRSDGVFAYQLAVSADDAAMSVSEVVRGKDLLSSTPRQIWLLRTLGHAPLQYCHVPLLLAADGRRLAKRDADLEISALREKGWKAEQILGLLAFLSGLLPKWQAVSARELISVFNWEKIRKKDIYMPEIGEAPSEFSSI